MTTARWVYVAIATVILIVSASMAFQGSTSLWFTAAAMVLAVISVLWGSRKKKGQSPDQSAE